jgi:hypothetical protein
VARQVAELSADAFQRLMGGVQALLQENLNQYTAPPTLPGQPHESHESHESSDATAPRPSTHDHAAATQPKPHFMHPLGATEEEEDELQPMRPRVRSSVPSALMRRRSSVSSATGGGKKASVMLKSIPSTVKEAAPVELTAESQQRIISTIKQNVIFANLEPSQLKVCPCFTRWPGSFSKSWERLQTLHVMSSRIARWAKLRARWVTQRARWVTLRARWPAQQSCLPCGSVPA